MDDAVHVRRQELGNHQRNADAKMTTSPDETSRAARSRSVSMPRPSSARPDVNYRIDEHARCHDIIRAQATRGHEFLDFRDDIVGRHRHQRIEIPRGMAVGQIAGVVTAVGVDESEVGANGFLHQKRFPADIDAFSSHH